MRIPLSYLRTFVQYWIADHLKRYNNLQAKTLPLVSDFSILTKAPHGEVNACLFHWAFLGSTLYAMVLIEDNMTMKFLSLITHDHYHRLSTYLYTNPFFNQIFVEIVGVKCNRWLIYFFSILSGNDILSKTVRNANSENTQNNKKLIHHVY